MLKPMPSPSAPTRVQIGGIYTIPSNKAAVDQRIRSSLKHGAWNHMVLVLGALPARPGFWRIMTVPPCRPHSTISLAHKYQISTKRYDRQTSIPFYPLSNYGPYTQHPQLKVLPGGHFDTSRGSYLRTEEEYWIEARGLQELVGRVPYKGYYGLNKVLGMLAWGEAVRKEQDRMAEQEEDIRAGDPRDVKRKTRRYFQEALYL